MKNLLFFFILFSNLLIGQDNTFKEYSYSQFFRLIEEEQDTVFVLKDAIIRFDLDLDLDFKNAYDYEGDSTKVNEIVIKKEVKLSNVHFLRDPTRTTQFRGGVISYVHFKKPIYISSTYGVQFDHCTFEKGLEIRNNEKKVFDFSLLSDEWVFHSIEVKNSTINDYLGVILDFPFTKPDQFSLLLFNNIIKMGVNKGNGYGPRANGSYLSIKDIPFVNLSNNQFIGKNSAWVSANDVRGVRIINNQFEQVLPFFSMRAQQTQNIDFENNQINKPTVLELTGLKSEFDIDYKQFKQGILNYENWRSFVSYINDKEQQDNDSLMKYPPEDIFDHYNKVYRIQNLSVFKNEVELRGRLINVYREKHDRKFANAIYMDMKDLETDRLAYEYKEEKNFTSYFTWKVNQFLKIFSAYGTEPARAIIFSLYVILFFALIYLFFPNSWDSHGRNRIIDRYTFFMKYMRRKAGIHEVYMEDKKEELLTYEKFRCFIESSEHEVPKVFTATAWPLYKWAICGTRISSGFLKRIDIMKGTWNELPQSKRWWKGILLIGAFTIAIVYDLIIKMLNALMLSINTFTTLGFGEIPIKGLPRYLAIIQGFIGWFMLTIFSVSLISQLLN